MLSLPPVRKYVGPGPPGNRLEPLKGDRVGSFSVRVNDQSRITFRFEGEDAHDVRREDFH